MSNAEAKIVVIGAGIVGASIAWHLAQRGARVTVVAESAPGGVATPNSFSWINSNPRFPRSYFELRSRSMAEWRRLASELPGLPVRLDGSLYPPCDDLDLEAFARQHADWGYRVRLIDGDEAKRLEPRLALACDRAVHAEDEGAAEASDVARLLVEAARDRGATVRYGMPVQGLAVTGGRVTGVATAEGAIAADEIVLAAGTGTPALLRHLGVELPLETPAGLLVHTGPMPPVLNGLVLADGLHVRQTVSGGLILGAGNEGSLPEGDTDLQARELMRRLTATLDLPEKPTLARITIGYRPTPPDGFPVVGRLPGIAGLYVAVMHSGVTLAPAVGLFAAQELLDGERDPLLAPYGTERFVESVAA